jgi:hypothetical protein
VAPGTRIALGDVRSGESWTRSFALNAGGGDSGGQLRAWGVEEETLRKITFNDKPRDVLFHDSFFPSHGSQAQRHRGAAFFFGWVRDPEPPLEIGDPRIRMQHYALYRTIVPLAGAEEE